MPIARLRRAALPAVLLLAACTTPPPADTSLDAVLWMATSAERAGLCLQAFHAAQAALQRALVDPTWSACLEQGPDAAGKPPAIIADVDDTLLDTSGFNRLLALGGAGFEPGAYAAWAEQAEAPALPGAADFLRDAAARGVTVFYLTNRGATLREATRRNLARAGFPLAEGREVVLCRQAEADKGGRRAAVAREFRVLLLLGDSTGDFSSAFAGQTPADRRRLALESAGCWGERWIVLPNPTYSDWTRALLGWRDVPAEEQLAAKREALQAAMPER
jgi:acid phosphatase